MSAPPSRVARLARVRDLHAISPADLAVEELRSAIFNGKYYPGEIISLRTVAEKAGCRLHVLLAYVRMLERDGLIVIRHDVAMVRPLDPDELQWAYRIAHQAGLDLIERAVEKLEPADLDRIDSFYPQAPFDTPDYPEKMARFGFQRLRVVVGKIATSAVLEPVFQTMQRHFTPWADRPNTPVDLRYTRAVGELDLVSCYRARRWPVIRACIKRTWAIDQGTAHSIVDWARDSEATREYARIIRLRR